MSAWQYMGDEAREQAVQRVYDVIPDAADGDIVAELIGRYGARLFEAETWFRRWKRQNTDEGMPATPSAVPPESPACDGTPAPAAAEHAPGEGGPDGGRSTVAGATSAGGGETERDREGRASAPLSPPPQIKRQKVTRPLREAAAPKVIFASQRRVKTIVPVKERTMAGPLPPEPKHIPEPNEVALTIYLDRRVLDVIAGRAKKAAYTRAQMAAAILTQACRQ